MRAIRVFLAGLVEFINLVVTCRPGPTAQQRREQDWDRRMRRQFASEAVEARMDREYGPEIDLGCFDRCRAIADGTLDLPLGEFLDLLDAEIERSDAP